MVRAAPWTTTPAPGAQFSAFWLDDSIRYRQQSIFHRGPIPRAHSEPSEGLSGIAPPPGGVTRGGRVSIVRPNSRWSGGSHKRAPPQNRAQIQGVTHDARAIMTPQDLLIPALIGQAGILHEGAERNWPRPLGPKCAWMSSMASSLARDTLRHLRTAQEPQLGVRARGCTPQRQHKLFYTRRWSTKINCCR